MKKKVVSFLIMALLIGTVFSVSGSQINNKTPLTLIYGNTLYVGGNGPGNYTKIQDAINDANEGDTVFVYNDKAPYNELLQVYKSINLIGEYKENTIVDGNFEGTVIDIQADNVLVSGFKFLNSKVQYEWGFNVMKITNCNGVIIDENIISLTPQTPASWVAGIYINGSSNNIISDNLIYQDQISKKVVGIVNHFGAYYNNFTGNELSGFEYGFYSTGNEMIFEDNFVHHNKFGVENCGDNNRFINNIITHNEFLGLYNYQAYNTLISMNTITDNGRGDDLDECGIKLSYGSNNQISDNLISGNNYDGIQIDSTENNCFVKYNKIINNEENGIDISGSGNQISHNHIAGNDLYGIEVMLYGNVISMNNFINNGRNAFIFTMFMSIFLGGWNNDWNNNYWDDLNNPYFKIIPGILFLGLFIPLPIFDVDINPSSEKYDLG